MLIKSITLFSCGLSDAFLGSKSCKSADANKYLTSSNSNFLCEVRTDIFKFYIDLDFLYISEINDTDLLFYTYNIQRILDYLIEAIH